MNYVILFLVVAGTLSFVAGKLINPKTLFERRIFGMIMLLISFWVSVWLGELLGV